LRTISFPDLSSWVKGENNMQKLMQRLKICIYSVDYENVIEHQALIPEDAVNTSIYLGFLQPSMAIETSSTNT
jgi:hypothetical protein